MSEERDVEMSENEVDWQKRFVALEEENRRLALEKENIREERNEMYRHINYLRIVIDGMKVDSDAQKRAFCRNAAIAMYAGPSESPETAWICARDLWDAKPEDL